MIAKSSITEINHPILTPIKKGSWGYFEARAMHA
jgi:hypothetical protein